jgi:NCAIR mutase (PurE)-related protein
MAASSTTLGELVVELDEIANLDLDRAARRGYPEAVFCAGKTVEQVAAIAAEIGRVGQATLFTRADAEQAAAVLRALPDAGYDAEARLVAWPADPPPVAGGPIVVVTAGTSDLPVAREALLTARHLGREVELVVDVGVAGLHRILARVELLRRARVVVVVAGMDGALPSVVAGLVSAPVVAVPTSVGYGAAFEGLAALLTMLNACAPGVAVVNIDNGYGAGHLAAQIAAPPEPAPPQPALPEPRSPEPELPEPELPEPTSPGSS